MSKTEKRFLIRGANAGERLGRHRMNGLVFANAEGIFVTDKGLRVQLEGFTHQLGNSRRKARSACHGS